MIIIIMIIIGGLFLKPIQMSICLCFKLSYTCVHLSVCLSHHQILQKNYCHSWFQRGEDTGLFPKFIHCPCVCSCWLCSLLVTWLSLFTWKKVSRQYRAFVLQIQIYQTFYIVTYKMNEMDNYVPSNIRLINPISKRFTANGGFISDELPT